MRIYISGKITGDENYKQKFAEAEKILEEQGHEVINPARVAEALPELTYQQYLDIDYLLIEYCDAIYMLEDWIESKGARAEYGLAIRLHKEIFDERELADESDDRK